MVNSINTNAGALASTQNLRNSRTALNETQQQISTGSRVNGPDDNAALQAISNLLESDLSGLNVTKDSLNRAISTTDVSIAAGTQVSNLLIDLRETALRASDPGLDDNSRRILNDEFTALRDQVNSIVENATFNGINAIQSGGSDITAITGTDGQETVTIEAQDLSLGGSNVTLAEGQTIGTLADAQTALAALDESLTNVGSALSEFGAAADTLDQLRTFTETLGNTTEAGLGNLIDADLATVNAEFQAGQVREALGRTALNIANQQSSNILTLFNG